MKRTGAAVIRRCATCPYRGDYLPRGSGGLTFNVVRWAHYCGHSKQMVRTPKSGMSVDCKLPTLEKVVERFLATKKGG